jgi:hypothetical protein
MARVLSSFALMVMVTAGPVTIPSDVVPVAGFSLEGDEPSCDENQLTTCFDVARQTLEDCETCRTTSGAPSALDTCQRGQCRADFDLQRGACYNLYCPGKSKP